MAYYVGQNIGLTNFSGMGNAMGIQSLQVLALALPGSFIRTPSPVWIYISQHWLSTNWYHPTLFNQFDYLNLIKFALIDSILINSVKFGFVFHGVQLLISILLVTFCLIILIFLVIRDVCQHRLNKFCAWKTSLSILMLQLVLKGLC